MKDKQLFTSFSTSYKEFKSNFCKVAIRPPGWPKYFFDDGQPKFPLYWTEQPNRVDSWLEAKMTDDERDVITQIDLLPWKILSHQLIELLRTDTLRERVLGKYHFLQCTDWSILTRLNFLLCCRILWRYGNFG